MSIFAAITLFGVMLALAALPSASVALVLTRSVTQGARNGIAVAMGIVLGDLLFVAMALLGLSALAEIMGAFFAVFKYIGGLYLIWVGFSLIRSSQEFKVNDDRPRRSTLVTSFAAGFLLTLGDVKAILFYASLFPAFVDMSALSVATIALIILITVLTVGGVKIVYAVAAQAIYTKLTNRQPHKGLRQTAGALMVGSGTYVILKA